MGACATKLSGDPKVKGDPPVVVEDGVAPPVAEGEKASKADGVPTAAETTDPADVSRRRSLSDLLKEDAEASEEEAGQDAVKVVTVDSVVATDEAEAPKSVSEDVEAGALAIVCKEAAEAAKAPQAAVEVKVVTVDSVVATDDEAGAQASLAKEEEAAEATHVAVEPSAGTGAQDATAEQLTDDHKTGQEPGGDAQAAAEEEKRVDPDSVQVATVVAAVTAEGSEVVGGASA